MRTGPKVAVYGLALALVFGGAWAAGAVAGPFGNTTQPHDQPHAAAPRTELPPGLSVSQNGYTLHPVTTTGTFQFHILGPDNAPVTKFAVEHEKRLHLVVVRRDGAGFQHVHPEMAPDGTWSVPLTLPDAGSYRVFADFKPEDGPKTTLGTDIQQAGDYQPHQHKSDSRVSTVDGYTVTLTGDLTAGASSVVTTTVTKDGRPVTDLQPYLGASGHLVTLRSDDLAYLHVHPMDTPGEVKFAVEVPTNGRYLLYLDFKHQDQVRTAEFTLETNGTPGTTDGHGNDGHGNG